LKRALAAAAVLALARVAHAGVEAPHARDVAVAYPAGAHGEAVVVLEVVVAPDGTVTSVRVLAGAEPFLAVAMAAAPSFRFDPATRDGQPISARIRIEVPFHEAPHAAPVAPVTRVRRVLAKPPPIPGVEDVHVRGVRHEIGGTVMTKEEVRDIPGAFGDAFRAIDMMPGVTPIVSGVPFFFVRGAPPGNTGYFIDGVRVPLLYHLALGPSVIHPSLIDRVDFYPGGFPAPYGRYTGGIVAGETRGPSSRIGGEAEVRLFDAGALGEAPFANGKGDALVAGRYGYPALLVPLFAPGTSLGYWDYQGRVSYRVAPRDTLTAFVFGSFDELDQGDATAYDAQGNPTAYGPLKPIFRTEFHRADLRWDHAVPGGNLRTALTFGIDDSLAAAGDSERVQAESIQLRTELDRRISSKVRLRAGADALLYHYDYTRSSETSSNISFTLPVRNDVIFGAYVDTIWQIHPRVEIVPGLRADVYTSRAGGDVNPNSPLSLVTGDEATAQPALDPRLAVRVTTSKRLTWVATLGLMHQPPSFAAPVPGGELGTLSGGLQSAVQASQGFESKLPWDLELKGTLFLQRYFDMTNAFATCSSLFDSEPDLDCLKQRTNGRSVGFEVMLRRSFSKRIGGWISYTFSRSVVEVPHPSRGEASEVPSNFDRTHVLNVALAFDLGKGWHAGGRFTYYTGLPYTESVDGIPIPPFNDKRLPDFWRVDLRIEKRWRLGKRGEIALVLEGMNVTLNKEAIAIDCSRNPCRPQTIGPVTVPSLGIEAKY
jgi:TonB family protein